MADEEKKEKKDSGGSGQTLGTTLGEILAVVAGLLIGVEILSNLLAYIGIGGAGSGLSSFNYYKEFLISKFFSLFPLFEIISLAISGIMILMIIYLSRGIGEIRAAERSENYPAEVAEDGQYNKEKYKNPKWERVETHINSDNPSDWKFSILEADIMLDELLERMSYHGASMGDKLKQIEKSDFRTLDEAWEAHKVRNQIAHEGGEFLISEREAKRIIGLYRQVFEEFEFI